MAENEEYARVIKTYYYYAGLDGKLLTGEGWHTIDDWSAVYTDAAGKVSKYIYYDASIFFIFCHLFVSVL